MGSRSMVEGLGFTSKVSSSDDHATGGPESAKYPDPDPPEPDPVVIFQGLWLRVEDRGNSFQGFGFGVQGPGSRVLGNWSRFMA